MAAQLRVFPESQSAPYAEAQDPNIRISLRDLLPLIAVAQRRNYLWLNDFLDDEVCVTSDLYEVLCLFAATDPRLDSEFRVSPSEITIPSAPNPKQTGISHRTFVFWILGSS